MDWFCPISDFTIAVSDEFIYFVGGEFNGVAQRQLQVCSVFDF
jgi:hypothetical protein